MLAGCVDTAAELGAPRAAAPQRTALVARPGVSPRGASVTVASLEGVSEQTAARFRQFFASAAESRDIAMVAPEAAQYRLRGYLTATASQNVARLAYVWDVFDRQGRRAQRLGDEMTVAVAGDGNPWDALDDKTSAEIARRAADDLAAFLTNTPEAIAAANGRDSGVSVVSAQRSPDAGAKPTGYAQAK